MMAPVTIAAVAGAGVAMTGMLMRIAAWFTGMLLARRVLGVSLRAGRDKRQQATQKPD